jgi:ATP-dependent Lon protease
MKIDNDVKKWLVHVKTSNINRKRKADFDEDNLIKELTYYSTETLFKSIKKEKFNKKTLKLFLESTKFVFTQSMKIHSKNKNPNILLANACSSISINLIDEILEEINKNKKFNILNFLNEKKAECNVSKKDKKLHFIKNNFIKNNDDNDIDDKTEGSDDDKSEDYDDDDSFIVDDNDDDDDYEDDDEYPINLDKNTTNFLSELKKISKTPNTTNDIIDYFKDLNKEEQGQKIKELNEIIKENTDKMPYVFKILQAPIKINTKKNILSKIFSPSGFGFKNRKWIDDVMKLPFGNYKGLNLESIKSKKITSFLNNLTELMDKAVYGHDNAKKQIVNIMAQQIRNPNCQGGVIALWGPPGNGKTSLIKEGIAKAMDKPFIFISLGGAQDSSFLDGHSFTYEGSIYGRIAQALMDAKCMNPIIYFDELDKVSTGPKGEEIINLLIH